MCWRVLQRPRRADSSTPTAWKRALVSTPYLPVIESLRTPLGHVALVVISCRVLCRCRCFDPTVRTTRSPRLICLPAPSAIRRTAENTRVSSTRMERVLSRTSHSGGTLCDRVGTTLADSCSGGQVHLAIRDLVRAGHGSKHWSTVALWLARLGIGKMA